PHRPRAGVSWIRLHRWRTRPDLLHPRPALLSPLRAAPGPAERESAAARHNRPMPSSPTRSSNRLPTLLVSHRAPTLPIDPGPTAPFLRDLGEGLRRPAGIVCVSAHWDTQSPRVTGASAPETIHDFGGFPQELYDLRYPARGDPALARLVVDLLGAAGKPAAVEPKRGLDHGAWVPMLLMFPAADVPVVQLSVQSHLD